MSKFKKLSVYVVGPTTDYDLMQNIKINGTPLSDINAGSVYGVVTINSNSPLSKYLVTKTFLNGAWISYTDRIWVFNIPYGTHITISGDNYFNTYSFDYGGKDTTFNNHFYFDGAMCADITIDLKKEVLPTLISLVIDGTDYNVDIWKSFNVNGLNLGSLCGDDYNTEFANKYMMIKYNGSVNPAYFQFPIGFEISFTDQSGGYDLYIDDSKVTYEYPVSLNFNLYSPTKIRFQSV